MNAFQKLSAKVYEYGLQNSNNIYGVQVFVSTVNRTIAIGDLVVTDMISLAIAFSEWLDCTEDAGEALIEAIKDTGSY